MISALARLWSASKALRHSRALLNHWRWRGGRKWENHLSMKRAWGAQTFHSFARFYLALRRCPRARRSRFMFVCCSPSRRRKILRVPSENDSCQWSKCHRESAQKYHRAGSRNFRCDLISHWGNSSFSSLRKAARPIPLPSQTNWKWKENKIKLYQSGWA